MDFQYYLQQLKQNLKKGSERSHYYALKSLIDSALIGIAAVVEERGNNVGIPDFTIRRNKNIIGSNESIIGYIEAKKIGDDLNKIQNYEQVQRYLDSFVGQNLILTNFLEFRLFRDGKLYLFGTLGNLTNNQVINNQDFTKVADLINEFVNYQEKTINNYLELAQQMATYTRSVKSAIEEALKKEDKTGELTKLKELFSDLLIPDLDNQNFADMSAQTIAYGLFTALFYHAQNQNKETFNRQSISSYFGNKIPFLKGFFQTVIKTNIVTEIDVAINNLIKLFAKIDMINILENFGQETKQEEPVIHFYETFLASYEVSLRKTRGVYYTPEPVVYFMVKFVNDILKSNENFPFLQDGFANEKVTILDPATGTGTFIYQVITQIYYDFEKYGFLRWDQFFRDRKLLQRLYGFEILMTPYTIAHLKIQLFLERLGYNFEENERLNIFLTNALDEGLKKSNVLLGQYIAQEANSAAKVKNEIPILVILGNPPYAGHSANKNSWINKYVKDYYKVDDGSLNEKNPKWLQDDYVKFIRFGQWKIDKTGQGILAFITNHGYLDNPTFRGMRQSLLKSFSRIYIINLHGNAKKKEISPDGSKDENVFNIQQGVCITIFIKETNNSENMAQVYYYDVWGKRKDKYDFLQTHDFHNIKWQKVNPVSPFYLLVPQDDNLREEYNNYWKINDIMSVNVLGFQTHRDHFAIDFERNKLYQRIKEMRNNKISDQEFYEKYQVQDNRDWKLNKARQIIKNDQEWENKLIQCLYRPFDWRYCYFSKVAMDYPRRELINNVFKKENLCLGLGRQGIAVNDPIWSLISVSNEPIDANIFRRGGVNVFPLYTYPNTENGQSNLIKEKNANFSPKFLTKIQEKLGYIPTPEKIFYYIYGVLHSPTYRERYAEFLKIDFPRIPLTSNDQLFNNLADKGEELVNLHLMKSPKLDNLITTYQGDPETLINQIKYYAKEEKLTINKNCYIQGISEKVWLFKIGGYQVLDKWLKDRKSDQKLLSTEDLIYYQKIIVVLTEIIKIMTEIDEIIPHFPIL